MDQIALITSSPPPQRARISRDEMNLAEFPLTVLSTRTGSSQKTLEFKDILHGKNGELLERSWIITGADKFGLPTSSDDEVLLGLLKLTVDDGFRDRKVHFTRYELLRILRWTTEGRSYQRLQKALDRLTGVKIKATNAFYDNEVRSHSTKHFGIVDAYEINDGRTLDPKPSFFTWSDVIFNSFKVGYIKKLDLDFYLDLKSAVSKRLYRFLDKHFWYKSKLEISLFTLAHEKIGVSRNYQFASSLRQQLDPAFDELKSLGFLSGYEYDGKGKGTVVRIFAASAVPRICTSQPAAAVNAGAISPAIESDEAQSSLERQVSQLLLERGIKTSQIEKLVKGKPVTDLKRMILITSHFDNLVSAKSHLVSKSPVGFLYRAIENPQHFVLPGESARGTCQTQLKLNQSEHGVRAGEAKHNSVRNNASLSIEKERRAQSLEAEYMLSRTREAKRLREEVEPEILKRISGEVETALVKIRRSLSAERFKEVVEHGVDQKLLNLFAFPEFQDWIGSRRQVQ